MKKDKRGEKIQNDGRGGLEDLCEEWNLSKNPV